MRYLQPLDSYELLEKMAHHSEIILKHVHVDKTLYI